MKWGNSLSFSLISLINSLAELKTALIVFS